MDLPWRRLSVRESYIQNELDGQYRDDRASVSSYSSHRSKAISFTHATWDEYFELQWWRCISWYVYFLCALLYVFSLFYMLIDYLSHYSFKIIYVRMFGRLSSGVVFTTFLMVDIFWMKHTMHDPLADTAGIRTFRTRGLFVCIVYLFLVFGITDPNFLELLFTQSSNTCRANFALLLPHVSFVVVCFRLSARATVCFVTIVSVTHLSVQFFVQESTFVSFTFEAICAFLALGSLSVTASRGDRLCRYLFSKLMKLSLPITVDDGRSSFIHRLIPLLAHERFLLRYYLSRKLHLSFRDGLVEMSYRSKGTRDLRSSRLLDYSIVLAVVVLGCRETIQYPPWEDHSNIARVLRIVPQSSIMLAMILFTNRHVFNRSRRVDLGGQTKMPILVILAFLFTCSAILTSDLQLYHFGLTTEIPSLCFPRLTFTTCLIACMCMLLRLPCPYAFALVVSSMTVYLLLSFLRCKGGCSIGEQPSILWDILAIVLQIMVTILSSRKAEVLSRVVYGIDHIGLDKCMSGSRMWTTMCSHSESESDKVDGECGEISHRSNGSRSSIDSVDETSINHPNKIYPEPILILPSPARNFVNDDESLYDSSRSSKSESSSRSIS